MQGHLAPLMVVPLLAYKATSVPEGTAPCISCTTPVEPDPSPLAGRILGWHEAQSRVRTARKIRCNPSGGPRPPAESDPEPLGWHQGEGLFHRQWHLARLQADGVTAD
jgi:hypothetical protein